MEVRTAVELEAAYTTRAKLVRWYKSRNESTKWALAGVGVVAAGVAAAGALVAATSIGTVYVLSGVAGGAVARWALPMIPGRLNPFRDFHKDSTQTAGAREELESKWREASASGVTFDEFRKRERRLLKAHANELRYDRLIRAIAIGVGVFVGLGATHVRTGLLDMTSQGIDASLGTSGVGEQVVYGNRLMQRISRTVSHWALGAVSAIADTSFVTEAQASNGKICTAGEIPHVERKYPQGVPVFEDGLTERNRARTLKLLDRHLVWMQGVRAKFVAVMGTGRQGYYWMLAEIDNGIQRLTETRTFVQKAPLKDLSKSFGLNNFASLVEPAYQASREINSLPKYGGVWYSGAPHCLSEVFNLFFKSKGFDQLPQESARVLYEFYIAAYKAGLVPDVRGMTISEGWHPNKDISGSHMVGSSHNSGTAFDVGPTAENGSSSALDRVKMSDARYVYRMLALQLESRQFSVRFEPHTLDPKRTLRADVKGWLMWPKFLGGQGMSEARATQFLKAHWGNVGKTSAPHFHVEVLTPLRGEVPLAPERV